MILTRPNKENNAIKIYTWKFIHSFLTIITDVSNKYKCPISCTKYDGKHILNRDSSGLIFWVYAHLVSSKIIKLIRKLKINISLLYYQELSRSDII